MVKQHKDLRELFHNTLKDIYFAEKKINTDCAPKDGQGRAFRRAKGGLSEA